MAASLLLNTPPASPPAASAVQRTRESRPMTKPEPEPSRREAGPGFGEPSFGPDLDLLIEPRMNAPLVVADDPESRNGRVKDRLEFGTRVINPASTRRTAASLGVSGRPSRPQARMQRPRAASAFEGLDLRRA